MKHISQLLSHTGPISSAQNPREAGGRSTTGQLRSRALLLLGWELARKADAPATPGLLH